LPTPASAPIVKGPRVLESKERPVPVGHLTPAAIVAHPPTFTASGLDGVAPINHESVQPPTTQGEAQPRGTTVVATEFVLPPVPPAALPAPVTSPAPEPAPVVVPAVPTGPSSLARDGFAEFERTIPTRPGIAPRTDAPTVPSPDIVITPDPEPRRLPPLPVITPAANSGVNVSPVEPRSVPSVPAKELPDVSEAHPIATAEPGVVQESSTGPRDVALLVEQVFEDLRQRRLDDAKQRTQWLKQLVTNRRPSSESGVTEAQPVEFQEEPLRLQVDPQATPVDAADSEAIELDQPTTNCP
jgi:hypothetical protein